MATMNIMVQGTMSNVGKSVIAAGLCRIFTNDGYRVSPFKSQNMALNSYVTEDGLEMGRAQVMQAECAKRNPDVNMNPILLKPVSDRGSQVIVNGSPVGNMKAEEYFQYKTKLIPDIKAAYDKLSEDSDIIVIEGAGSPAEINLKENDIVNMGLAAALDAPVILVADIDPGGVFAQVYGTLMLLTEDERERVKGFIINKFRGDEKLLEPGIKMLEDLTGKKCLGVVPYLDVSLDDEDSLSKRFDNKKNALFDVCIIKLPHISNFTDFNTFSQSGDISVRYVKSPEEIKDPDLLILPGSKNTIDDLKWIYEKGFDEKIREYKDNGGIVFGICGGFQMLGKKIKDPEGIEGGGEINGLSLLDIETVITGEKKRSLFSGRILSDTGILSGLYDKEISGYEIHMGETKSAGASKEFTSDGTGYYKDNVFGTYVHGFFDNEEVLKGVIEAVAKRKNKTVDVSSITDYAMFKEKQYERLAEELRKHLDMDRIYSFMTQVCHFEEHSDEKSSLNNNGDNK